MLQIVVASRGRNPENPSDHVSRGSGIMQQRLEPNLKMKSNSLTTVEKDNWVLVYETCDTAPTA